MALVAGAQSLPASASAGSDSAGLGSAQCQPSPEQPFGWRGDGTGRYPAADPPLHWGRESVAVSKLRCQAARPKEGDTGQPMKQGMISEWLVAGPIEVPKDSTSGKDSLVANTGVLRPDEGEEAADTGVRWNKLSVDNTYIDWSTLFGRNHKLGLPPVEVLAHAYVFSPSGGAFLLHADNLGGGQVFINGKKRLGSVEVELVKGWNRVLLRAPSGKSWRWLTDREEFHSRVSFFGIPSGDYATRNVAWILTMPPSPGSASTPVIAGDRLFVTCNHRTLLCLNKKDGKVHWARTTTFYDAMTDAEKKAHPDIVQKIEPLAAKLRRVDESLATGVPAEGKKLELECQISKLMAKVDDKKYCDLGLRRGNSEVGVSVQTPVTDGKRVYVSYVAAMLVCFDLEGNRQWIRARELKLHGERVMYPPSPILTDGKFIAHNPWGTVALEAQTGQEKWRIARDDYKVPDIADPDLKRYFTDELDCITGSLLPLKLDNEPLVLTTSYVVRARDGKLLTCIGDRYGNGYDNYQTPIINGKTVYQMLQPAASGQTDIRVLGLPVTAAEPFKLKQDKSVRIDIRGFLINGNGAHNASPLFHEGLIYSVSEDGVLTVVDVEKGKLLYQKLLNADLFSFGGLSNGLMAASPTLAGKYIYLFGNQGTCLVIESGRSFRLHARNRLENMVTYDGGIHQDIMVSSPVFEGSRLYFRTDGYVYGIKEKP